MYRLLFDILFSVQYLRTVSYCIRERTRLWRTVQNSPSKTFSIFNIPSHRGTRQYDEQDTPQSLSNMRVWCLLSVEQRDNSGSVCLIAIVAEGRVSAADSGKDHKSPPLSRSKVMMAEMRRMAQKMEEGVAERMEGKSD